MPARLLLALAILSSAALAAPALAEDAPLTELTAVEAAAAIRAGEVRSADLVAVLLDRISANRDLNAFITIVDEAARDIAAHADADIAAGKEVGPLHGVPIVVKDNIAAADIPTTAATPGLAGFIPERTAPVLQKLVDAGAILIGKTNMHELAFGITSNNATYGAIANAYDRTRFAGGSSGGTGAAIAARLAPAGLGTDTGGSVRIPAALNGIAGFRPSTGRYPQAGIVPISHTRDTAGPMARSVADLVLFDGVITGLPVETAPAELAALRIGVPAAFVGQIDAETERLLAEAIERLREAGVTLVAVDLSDVMELNAKVGFPVALWEVRRDLPRFLEEGNAGITIEEIAARITSPDVKFVFDNLVLGDQAIPDAVYDEAVKVFRPQLQAAYAEVFATEHLDAILFPTTPLPAQPIEDSDQTVKLNGEDVPTFQTFIRNTDPGSNAGLPGLTLPIGLTKDGLPVGVEIDGPAHTDRHLLSIGLALEEIFGRLPAPGMN